MTVTTTALVATNSVIKVDNAAGTPTDVSGSSNKVQIGPKNGVGEFRAFSTQWKTRVVIGKDTDIKIDFVLSSAADEAYDLFKKWFWGGDDSARTVTIDVPDSTAGSDRYSGEAVLENLDMPLDAQADQPIFGSAVMKPSGEWTQADISA